jgi:hypothetical protein
MYTGLMAASAILKRNVLFDLEKLHTKINEG